MKPPGPDFIRNLSAWNKAQLASMRPIDREPHSHDEERRLYTLLKDYFRKRGQQSTIKRIAVLTNHSILYVRSVRTRILQELGVQMGDYDQSVDWGQVTPDVQERAIQTLDLMIAKVGLEDLHPFPETKEAKEKAALDLQTTQDAEDELKLRILGIKTDQELEQTLSQLVDTGSEAIKVSAVKTLNELRNRRRPQDQARLRKPLSEEEAVDRGVMLLDSMPKEIRHRILWHFRGEPLDTVTAESLGVGR